MCVGGVGGAGAAGASMKALPKRKGNVACGFAGARDLQASMKALPKRKGNWSWSCGGAGAQCASMKALPKRKGNTLFLSHLLHHISLNESPSEKEGKFLPLIHLESLIKRLNESPSEKEGKWLPETSPQPCGRNGCFARTSRRLHAKLYTPATSTPA